MNSSNAPAATEAESKAYRKVALAACFGTFIEWYDFLTFATLAVHFAVLFFPANDPVSGLLYSLLTFGLGMVVRPLGPPCLVLLGIAMAAERRSSPRLA